MPRNYPALAHAFYSTPWALLPAKLIEIQQFLRVKLAGPKRQKAKGKRQKEEEPRAEAQARKGDGFSQLGQVAVMQLYGVLSQKQNMLTDYSGGTSTELFGRAFDSLVQDGNCKAIVLCIDSPGGSVYGVKELADKIFAARGEKKIIAVADSLAASGAYWIGCQAGEFCCTPGGQAGSIGVFMAHDDESAAAELAGVKTTLVSAGRYKVEGNPYAPLDDEARQAMQATVDSYYGQFVDAVARGRGVSAKAVRDGYGQGRVLTAAEAKAAGMIDRVQTMEQVLARLGVGGEASARAEGGASRGSEVGRRARPWHRPAAAAPGPGGDGIAKSGKGAGQLFSKLFWPFPVLFLRVAEAC